MADTYISPTPERLAKAAHWDIPTDTQTINGRQVTKATRSGYRWSYVVHVMYQSGELRDEQKDAFDTIIKDFEKGDPEQYARMSPIRVDGDDNDDGCPIRRKVEARKRYNAAINSIGVINAIVIRHCFMPLASRQSVGFMLSAGEAVSHVTAIKRGKKAIQDATMALAIHYDYAKHPPSP